MSNSVVCDIREYRFNADVSDQFYDNHYVKALWPVVYLLVDKKAKEFYTGETTNMHVRIKAHLRNKIKSKFEKLYIITCNHFNVSLTREIESSLIKYISCDRKYKYINRNRGILSNNYFQKKELYSKILQEIWTGLTEKGIVKNSLKFISNSNFFKYSPYRSLTSDQTKVLESTLENLLKGKIKTTIIEGGAGTGKSVLAVFLFALLKADLSGINFREFGENQRKIIRIVNKLRGQYKGSKMALVVPMYSFRETLKKVFKKIDGLSEDDVISPIEIANQKYDFLIIEESHRLHRKKNLGRYNDKFNKASLKLGFDISSKTELDWVQKQGNKNVLFYDEFQSIKPSDVEVDDFLALKSKKSTCVLELSQLRCKGGADYVRFIHKLMNCSFRTNKNKYSAERYSFLMFESFSDLLNEIKLREQENELSRLIAGFAWPWVSKKNKKKYDIKIDQVSLRWNTRTSDWVHSPKAINEVGCIHTSQGYDLNYAAVILGKEISYDEKKNEIIILKDNYYDRNGKGGIKDPVRLKKYIINIYTTLLKRGIHGTYVYVCDPALRKYLSQYIPVYGGKNVSKSVLKPVVRKRKRTSGNTIPLLDVNVAARAFSL